MEADSRVTEFRDQLAFWLETISRPLSVALQEVVAPYDFAWHEVGILMGVRDAEGDFPLTKLLYPNPHGGGQNVSGQELFQRFKDAGMVTVRHSEDSPVMVELTKVGTEFLKNVEGGYADLQARLLDAASDQFLDDLKAVHRAL